MTIYTLSGIAGSGKTQRLISYADLRLKQHRKTVFVCCSVELCKETYARLIGAGVPSQKITLIHSQQRHAGQVGKRLLEHLQHADANRGEILIITAMTFFTLPHWPRPDLWCPLIDEVPQIHADFSRRLYQNFGFLTDLLEPEDLRQTYTTLKPKNPAAEELLRSRRDTAKRDEINELHYDLIVALLDPCWDVQCESRNWQQVVAGIREDDTPELKKERSTLRLYGFLKPDFLERFDHPVIAAACIEDHLFYGVWQQLGADIRPASHILERFGDCTLARHDGSRLLLRVLTGCAPDRLWSKTYADTELSDGRTPRQVIREFCDGALLTRPSNTYHKFYAAYRTVGA